MYKHLIRPLLFCLSAEKAHNVTMFMLRAARFVPFYRSISKALFSMEHPALEREVFGMKFPNPIGLAAGLDKNAVAYNELSALGFGFIEVGTITPKPQPGNPKPRLFRLIGDRAIINRMGFNNKGVEAAIKNLKHKHKTIVGGNLGKNTLTPNDKAPADYLKLFRLLYEHVDYFVINVSCPNVANLGKLQSSEALKEIVDGVTDFRRGQTAYRPILLKISPDLSHEQIDDAINVMRECGLDGIVATNTTISRDGLSTPSDVVASIGNGGLSGAPLTQRSLEIVRYVHEKTEGKYPIIGVGGILTEDDAVNMIKAGASLIQIYSGFIYNGPGFIKRICRRLVEEYEKENGAKQ